MAIRLDQRKQKLQPLAQLICATTASSLRAAAILPTAPWPSSSLVGHLLPHPPSSSRIAPPPPANPPDLDPDPPDPKRRSAATSHASPSSGTS
ncbi:hypothetical protein JCM6882_005153 [Rhodosporidiobolus microsporus]